MSHPVLSVQPLGFPWVTFDPFLFCVHHADVYPKGDGQLAPAASLAGRNLGNDFTIKDGWRMYHGMTIPGFPYHPHRGFETVTITLDGLIDHADSLGAAGRFGNGDVQWMTAGKGVQHSEMFPMLNEEGTNNLEFFQLWLNLPKKRKMVDPNFAMLWDHDVPVSEEIIEGGVAKVRVIAGNYKSEKAPVVSPNSWAAEADNDVAIWIIDISPHSKWTLPKTVATSNRALYFYKGTDVKYADKAINPYHVARLDPTQDVLVETGKSGASLVLLQGKAIDEPVAQHGPFVMNTPEEIHAAFAEYRQTKFGGWPWPRPDQVHEKSKGRFARFADGTLVEK